MFLLFLLDLPWLVIGVYLHCRRALLSVFITPTGSTALQYERKIRLWGMLSKKLDASTSIVDPLFLVSVCKVL